jgi:hypothetical protein
MLTRYLMAKPSFLPFPDQAGIPEHGYCKDRAGTR